MPSKIVTQTELKNGLTTICRNALRRGDKVYVKNKIGRLFMTLDPTKPNTDTYIHTVTAQDFKDNFADYSTLVKTKRIFRIDFRDINEPIFVRRHTRWRSKLDHVFEEEDERRIELIKKSKEVIELREQIAKLTKDHAELKELMLRRFDAVIRGLARHHAKVAPFPDVPGALHFGTDEEE